MNNNNNSETLLCLMIIVTFCFVGILAMVCLELHDIRHEQREIKEKFLEQKSRTIYI
jgi:hypothetical protein